MFGIDVGKLVSELRQEINTFKNTLEKLVKLFEENNCLQKENNNLQRQILEQLKMENK